MPQDLAVGDVVSESIATWRAQFLLLSLLSVAFYWPLLIVNYATVAHDALLWRIGVALTEVPFDACAAAAAMFATSEYLAGRRARFGECVTATLRRVGPILGVTVITSLGVLAGLVVLIVPGIILLCMWIVALPAVLFESRGIRDAISRSDALTSGRRTTIFWIQAVLFLIIIGVSLVSAIVDRIAGEKTFASVFGNWLATMLLSPLGAVATFIIYNRLKRIKEGAAA